MRRFLLFLCSFIVVLYLACPVHADDPTATCQTDQECEQKISEFGQKLSDLGKAKNTLANQISIIDSQVQLTLLKITQTQNSIKTLESEIADLTVKIGDLDVSLNQLTSVYINEITQNYKLQKKLQPFSIIFLSGGFNNFLEQYKYISVLQKNSQDTLVSMETVRTNYDLQKEEKNQKQAELEDLKTKLASQQVSLNKQKVAKSSLLEVTRNDEKKYQLLLAEVQNKLASFNNSSAGCLSSPAGPGSDGNYYSQIDPRWCSRFIGLQTKYTIGGAGCYLTSMSMVLTKIGSRIDPLTYASDPSKFTSSADLINPIPPSGYTYEKIGYSSNAIDNELKNGRYVIAEVPMPGSPSGSHFIVLISGSNGNYKMHDPWRGADLNFSDYYSTSRVKSLRLITK